MSLISVVVTILIAVGVIPGTELNGLSSNAGGGNFGIPGVEDIIGGDNDGPNPNEKPWTWEQPVRTDGDITVNQGDAVKSRAGSCTIGYIDRPNNLAYTAYHCIPVLDFHEREQAWSADGRPIGTFVYPKDYLPYSPLPTYEEALAAGSHKYDIIAIRLYDNVNAGENTYTGNTRVPYSHVRKGEQACFYGDTTRRVACGPITRKDKDSFMIDFEMEPGTGATHGDSGGPVWIPGRGSIGVLKGGFQRDGVGFDYHSAGNVATGY
ncbi:hypothetical protein [Corynebacterium phocae]|nr:hypothetical protein [Corynebacterium phocae]KAA8723556.1 hypothetical protein F4V58_06430 [Corynebacterium phocae]